MLDVSNIQGNIYLFELQNLSNMLSKNMFKSIFYFLNSIEVFFWIVFGQFLFKWAKHFE